MSDDLNPYPGNLNQHTVTSDRQEGYFCKDQIKGLPAVTKPEERVPLLSEPEYQRLSDGKNIDWAFGFKQSSDFYEDLITKGELAVVKTCKATNIKENDCDQCGYWFSPMMSDTQQHNFCPGCGARIVP